MLIITHWSVIYASWGNGNPVLQETHDDDPTGSGEQQINANHAGQQLGASDNAHMRQVITTHSFDPEMIDAEDNNTYICCSGSNNGIFRKTLSPDPEQN